MRIDPVAMGLMAEPLALIDVAVRVNKAPLPACLIIFPKSFIYAAILPNLNPLPEFLFERPFVSSAFAFGR